jgi:xanthine dehydrogenase large subunit
MVEYAATVFASRDHGREASGEHIVFADGRVYDDRVPIDAPDAEAGRHVLDFRAFCDQARRDRIDLGARGFYATPGVDFNRETGRGNPFFYYTTGAAVAEVTLDRFTGELVVDRVDLLMDVGRMINPGIDRGQVIGGFIQGMGWCTTEELVYDGDGRLLSTSPTTYKIPAISDTPRVFNVDFIANPKHAVNVRLSKAVGEPPLMLGIAPWLAVRHALSFAGGVATHGLRLPATPEEILMRLTAQDDWVASPDTVASPDAAIRVEAE